MRFDSIVVGGGLCGTLAAQHLEQAGRSVLLLEAGPLTRRALPGDVRSFQRATKVLTQVDAKRWPFRGPPGYEWYRVRALGGRTLLWGGWMQRPSADYFASRRRQDAAWGPEFDDLSRWVTLAERRLRVKTARKGGLHRRLAALGFEVECKREAVLPGARRMLTALDLRVSRVRQETVCGLRSHGKGVTLHLASGRELEAKHVVLAASPIETARLVGARTRVSFADHLIAGAMVITPRQRASAHPQSGADPAVVLLPSSRAKHRFTTEVRGPTPLEELAAEDVKALGFTAEQAAQHSFFVVFALGETDPHVGREVVLDASALDVDGRPTPRFVRRAHTSWEKALGAAMNARCLELAALLGGAGCEPLLFHDALDFGSGGHETATCVDEVGPHGELLGAPGVFVADGSGVPGATDGHPSLTLAANALRVATSLSLRSGERVGVRGGFER